MSAPKSRCDLIPTGFHTVAGLIVLGCATGHTLSLETPPYPKKKKKKESMLEQDYILS